MARINIEDKLWSDPRFEFLLLKTGNEFVAIGMVVKAFRVAQKYWLKDQGLIPQNIWDAFGLSVLVDCDLAEVVDGYIYVRGVAEQNDWLLKKQAAGKKSAESRLAQFGSNQPKKPEQCSSSVPNTSRTVFDPLEPPTPTPTPNLNSLMSVSTDPPVQKCATEKGKLIFDLWNTHCGNLSKARGFSKKRATSANARIKENPSESYWVEVITRMAASPFCRGEAGGTWRADFEFLLKPDTHLKVIEGKYDSQAKVSRYKTHNNEEVL